MQLKIENKVTIIIKTFNRKKALNRLLRSLDAIHCRCTILIADDSHKPYHQKIINSFQTLSIKYYTLPFDSGLSAGRNHLLQKVETPFFLLCDDDFMFPTETNLSNVLTVMEEDNLDIGGGTFLNYITINSLKKLIRVFITPKLLYRYVKKTPAPSAYIGNFLVEENSCTLFLSHSFIPAKKVFSCDMVNNFFIGRTDSIKNMGGWDETLKVGEHEDFFYRAKLAGLTTAFIQDFNVKHYPLGTKRYIAFRNRATEMKIKFIEKWKFLFYKEINTDSGTTIFEHKAKINM